MKFKKIVLLCLLLNIPWLLKAQSWSELGTGANTLNANEMINTTAIDAAGNIYAAGAFTNAAGKQYVAKWNGTSWTELGTGANALNANDEIKTLTTDPSGNVYAAGIFTNAAAKYYVAKWNGTSWTELGTGANALNANDLILSIASDAAGNIYATGAFSNTMGHSYVAKWDGTSWTELGTGANALNANSLIYTITLDAAGNLYAAGYFTNANLDSYVAKWNGSTWSELGTGANSLNANGLIYTLATDVSGNVYAAGYFSNPAGNTYVAKWNGTSWAELGTGANALNGSSIISSIAPDAAGNVYAGGFFSNAAGKQYVAKWNGISWSELGTGANALNANSLINSTFLDQAGNIYACGGFTNSSGKQYVAKWTTSFVAVDSVDVHTAGNVPATITASGGSLNMTAVVFPVTASQDVTWSIVPGTGTADITAAGVVNAQTNGTVWAKAVSVANTAKMDSLLINISNQTVAVDSVDVRTVGNVPATIAVPGGSLNMTAVVFPATASQDVTWSIVPGTGMATINPTTGVVNAQTNGTVWAKAVSVANTAKMDSLLINISNQAVAVDSVDVRTVGNVPATIAVPGGSLNMTAVVFPASANQAVTWSIVPGTGTANITAAGVVNAQTNGTVWAKAISVANTVKMDSLLINISNQAVAVDSVDVRTVGNVPAVITTLGAAGELPLTAIVFPANANQAVNWSIVPGTGTANISATGAVTGLTIGTVWAKAVSTSNTSKMDSLLIEIRGTGIKDKMADMGIKLYPNPAGKELFLTVEQAHNELEMKITDLSGRAVMTKAYTANSLNRPEAINIKELAPGIYFLRLKGSGMDITMKFIKK